MVGPPERREDGHAGAIERTHSGLPLHLLYPLHPKVPALRAVPRPVRRAIRRATTRAAVRAHMARCRGVTMVGVTGSTGKTTTKDLLADMLSAAGPASRTHHNDNGLYGVPSSLLSVRPTDRFAVIELGILDGPGEMRWMADLFRPRVAILTGIGDDHSGRFGGRAGIAREKSALLARLGADGVAVVNADDELGRATAVGLPCRVVLAGRSPDADVRLLAAELDWPDGLRVVLAVDGRELRMGVALHGRHLAPAVPLALAAALACGVSAERAFAGAASFRPRQRRFEPRPGPAGSTFIVDDFESRAHTALPAFAALGEVPARRRIVVLGEIQECPLGAPEWQRIAATLADVADRVLAVGAGGDSLAGLLPDARHLTVVPDVHEAARQLSGTLGAGDVVLLHGYKHSALGGLLALLDD